MPTRKLVIDRANRLFQLPPDILAFVKDERQRALRRKIDIVDLAHFRWPIDFDTPELNGAALSPAGRDKIISLKEAIAEWYADQHRVELHPAREIFLGGSITSMCLLVAMAFVDPGDLVFVPSLGLPTYRRAAIAAGAQPLAYNLSAKTNWHPDLEPLRGQLGRVARLMFLNSPHNPSGSELDTAVLQDLVNVALRDNVLLVNDAAYQSYPSHKVASLLSAENGANVAVELHSLAYTFGLPRLPFGFAAGNREVIAGLEQAGALQGNYLPSGVVDMALSAIRRFPGKALTGIRQEAGKAAAEAGKLLTMLELEKAGADSAPYLWARIERRAGATSLASVLFRRGRVLVVPGTSFGDTGEGYIRLSLTVPPDQYTEAVKRLEGKLRFLKLAQEVR